MREHLHVKCVSASLDKATLGSVIGFRGKKISPPKGEQLALEQRLGALDFVVVFFIYTRPTAPHLPRPGQNLSACRLAQQNFSASDIYPCRYQ